MVSEWRNQYNPKCLQKYKDIYKTAKAEIRDFLRDLLILESFASRHCDDNDLIKLIKGLVVYHEDSGSDHDDLYNTMTTKPEVLVEYEKAQRKAPKIVHLQLKIIDNEGNAISDIASVFPDYADTSSVNRLEIEDIRAGDVHAEMKNS